LWELPLAVGLQLQHAALVANGAKTMPNADTIKRMIDEVANG
jgi:hypothetical protein